MEVWLAVTLCAAAFVVGAAIFGFVMYKMGIEHRKKTAEAQIESAEKEASRIVSEANEKAQATKKTALVEAKDEIFKLKENNEKEIQKLKSETERELKERRAEVTRSERRLQQKEENLDKKNDKIERLEEQLQNKNKKAEEKLAEAESIKKSQMDILEKISGFTLDQAKEHLLSMLDSELSHEKAVKITAYEQRLKDECDEKARQYISLAISRLAADTVSEVAVSVVPLPNDEMKGRIIGREGRNIRALEQLTGVDLIIDDTPEAITLSCHDHVRREIARIALEKLIQDGRIHPTRIEETVEKARREVELKIKQEGERAVMETNVNGLHHELVRLIGRLYYRTSYRQNVLNHSIEVAHLAGIMASELGVDATLARRAGLLHDIGKPSVKTTDNSGQSHFQGHQLESKKIADRILHRLRLPSDFINKTLLLIEYHDVRFNGSKKLMKKVMNVLGTDLTKQLLEVEYADISAQSEYQREEKLGYLETAKTHLNEIIKDNECFKLSQLDINGKDVLNLGVKEGRDVGNILDYLLMLVVDANVPNKKSILISKAKEYIYGNQINE